MIQEDRYTGESHGEPRLDADLCEGRRRTVAWVLAQKPWIVPIPGTTKMAHMDENIVLGEVRLTPDEFGEINASSSVA